MKTIVVSFSGGRSSALMAKLVNISPMYEEYRKIYVFANTGKEREETLRFVHECDKRWNLGVVWLEAVVNPEKGKGTRHRIVSYETAVRNTDRITEAHPFNSVTEKYGLPSNAFPHCTRELKLSPITSYLKSEGITNYITAIGIRADEATKRGKIKDGIVYPLIEMGINEQIVREYWAKQPFDLQLKDYEGNCDLCFKKSLRKRLTILREHPEYAAFWSSLEGARKDHKGEVKNLVFDRTGLSIKNLLELSTDPELLVAVDKHDARLAEKSKNAHMFEPLSEINLDHETDCLCKST